MRMPKILNIFGEKFRQIFQDARLNLVILLNICLHIFSIFFAFMIWDSVSISFLTLLVNPPKSNVKYQQQASSSNLH